METREIPGYPKYYASSDGRIWSAARGQLRQLKPYIHRVGNYKRAQVSLGRGFRNLKVASLICATFNGPRPLGHETAHLNGNSLDNRAENLAWKTRTDNELDKIEHGTSNRGTRQWQAKLTNDDVRDIRRLASSGVLQKQLMSQYNVSQPTISGIVNRKSWAWLD